MTASDADDGIAVVGLETVPELAAPIARRYHDAWSRDDSPRARERALEEVRQSLDTASLPVTRVATRGGRFAGAAQLKVREMARYPEFEWWLGGVFVEPGYRGAGLATRLVAACADEAVRRGIPRLHLQTERPDGGLYARAGWRPVERIVEHGLDKLVMVRELRGPRDPHPGPGLRRDP